MSLPIEDYALIGDRRTAALVGKNGSIDWLCMPRFDSAACFAALLGGPEHGRWQIAPRGGVTGVRRRYREGTLILETEFRTDDGAATVIDLMPSRARDERMDLLRVVRGERGEVPMELDLTLRFDYGRTVPWVRRRDYGLHGIAGPDAVAFCSPVELKNRDFRTHADFMVRAGQSVSFSLVWHQSHLREPPERNPEKLLAETEAWWLRWSRKLRYDGPWRENVMRSLIVLKALSYEPTGGMVAAPTTSLPERIGGKRNWDYRYCWLRDTAFTLNALLSAGYKTEARAWREWLLRAVAGRPDEIQIMYGVAGERRLGEVELPWLPGYEGSLPVRVGNEAHAQLQLDVFGEVMDLFESARDSGLDHHDDAWRVEKALLDWLESNWQKPGSGIWEIRGEPRRFTHSALMAWVGVDRSIRAVEHHGLEGPVEKWRALRAAIHEDVLRHGYDAERNSFVQHFGGKALDASLLLIPISGFLAASDSRVQGTIEAVMRELMVEGFVKRYQTRTGIDGLPPGEGAFLPCSFWLADALYLSGRRDEARSIFERTAGVSNDVGLLAEEYDPRARRQLGNFPQAFSHIALVNAAFMLAGGRRATRHSMRPRRRAKPG